MSMSGSPNFGILQPQQSMAPIRSASPQASAAPMGGGGGGGGMLDPYAAQKMQMAQQSQDFAQKQDAARLGLETASNQSNLATQAANRGLLGIEQQKGQNELAAQQYGMKVRQAASTAYTQATESGKSPYEALNATADVYASSGDPAAAAKLMDTSESLRQKIKAGKQSDVADDAQWAHQVMTASQQLNLSPLEVAKRTASIAKKQGIDVPDLSSFKNDQEFEDTYIHPVMAMGSGPLAQRMAQQKADGLDALGKATNNVNDAKDQLRMAVKSYGVNSIQAKEAIRQVNLTQENQQRVARGGDTGTVGSVMNFLKSPSTESNASIVDNATAQPGQTAVPQPAANMTGGSAPASAPATKVLNGVTYTNINGKWGTTQ